ncbi:MAG: Na/Pi cotransporter family protein [Clostridiales bacterium]|nr:Na/Pi cotransporter family protein [Clostridiales bacterium]
MNEEFFFHLLKLLLGLSFFMFGMKVMSDNLERLSGGQLEKMLKKATSVPIVSLMLGAAITIAIQSSSATTVMLVGLVNSGIMTFSQTIAVIFGANIGTTLTAWILSLSGIDSDNFVIQMIKPENFSPILAFIGIAMCMFSKKEKRNNIGTIFVGFAVLMYGMEFMTDAVSPLQDVPEFRELMVSFSNPLIGVIVGALFTAIIQSSAASVGILQALSITGSVSYGIAIPIIMGQNIGTCITSVISSIGTSTQAKRVAVVHTLINVLATVFVLIVFYSLHLIIGFEFMTMPIDPTMIALVHTIFNVVATAVLMPCTKLLVKLTEWLVKDKAASASVPVLYLDERLLLSPSIAVGECDNATKRMMRLSKESLFMGMTLFDKYDQTTYDKVKKLEDDVDIYEDKLGSYLVKLSSKELSERDSKTVSKMLHTIGNFERLSDHAVGLAKATKEMADKGISFSANAKSELRVLADAITEILIITGNAYETNNTTLAGLVEPLEQVIDNLTTSIKSNHIARVRKGECSIELGFILHDVLGNYQRVSDHCSNIAVAIIEAEKNSFDTHKYLNDYKYGNEDFNLAFESFAEKYRLAK